MFVSQANIFSYTCSRAGKRDGAKKLFELNLLDGASKQKSRSEAVSFGFVSAGLAAVGTAVGRASARQMAADGGGERPFVRAQKRVRVVGLAGRFTALGYWVLGTGISASGKPMARGNGPVAA